MNNPKNLLIIRTDRIGDVVLSLPMAGIIKKYYPGCRVTFLLREYTSPLALNHPDVDEIIILKEESGKIPLAGNLAELKKRKFDACIVVSPVLKTALIAFLSGIKIRIGTGYRWYSFLFNRKIFVHRKYGEKHELEFNMDMLQQLGINYQAKKGGVNFNIKPDEKSIKKIVQLLTEEKIKTNEPIIIVHPGSGGSAVDLPAFKMKELVSLLAGKKGVQVILTGSNTEYDLCNSMVVPGKVLNFAGKLSLPDLIALIDRASIFIANSTGPIHIAAALGKHVIGFYPNFAACSPRRWGPYTSKSYVFSPEGECEDCRREQCASPECMSTIKVTDVFDRVEKICQILENNGDIND